MSPLQTDNSHIIIKLTCFVNKLLLIDQEQILRIHSGMLLPHSMKKVWKHTESETL